MSSRNTQMVKIGNVSNSTVDIQQKINEASHLPDDLKTQLNELTKAVARMNQSLSKKTAERVTRDLKTLTDEATSDSPRQQWWQLSIDGLIKAAQDVGQIGKPVIEIAAKLVPLLLAISG